MGPEVSVVSPLPAVLGGDDKESYSASWSAGSTESGSVLADECPMSAQLNNTLDVNVPRLATTMFVS